MGTDDLQCNYNWLTPYERKHVRNMYVEAQSGNCSHCGKPLNGVPSDNVNELLIDEQLFPKTFFKWPVHLHHCHKTGLTIGAVHAKCNAVLWQYHGE